MLALEKVPAVDRLLTESRARRRLPEPPVRRLLRERALVSQDEIAAAIGVTRSAVSRWESGRRSPTGQNLHRYLAILDQLVSAGE